MPAEALLEAVPAEHLQAELTRRVAERLAQPKTPSSSGSLPTTARVGKNRSGYTDMAVIIDGDRYVVETKKGNVDGEALLRAVHAAMGDLLGAGTRVLLLPNDDRALAPVISAVMEQVPNAVRARRQALTERHIEALVDVYLAADPLAAAMPNLERDNAQAQSRFLQAWPVLSAEAVAEQAGHDSTNRSATTSRWKKARKIFGVRVSGREAYPSFQFQEGRPRPVIGRVLSALPATLSGWQTAFWFVGPNSWLADQPPATRLDDEAAVVAAAEHESETWMG